MRRKVESSIRTLIVTHSIVMPTISATQNKSIQLLGPIIYYYIYSVYLPKHLDCPVMSLCHVFQSPEFRIQKGNSFIYVMLYIILLYIY